MNKLIITLAMLGNVPTKQLNPDTPVTPVEIAECIHENVNMGVSIAHIHARDEKQEPTHNIEVYSQILKEIKERKTNVITQLSTGARGGPNTIESRGQMLDVECDMGSLATGSSNFASTVNSNSPELIEYLAKKMTDNGIKPEIEVFDAAMIENANKLVKKGILKSPLHFNLVMNVPGSIPGTPKNLMYLMETLPKDSTWSVSGIGSSQVPMLTMAILLGGHVRTGLEDTLYYSKGVLATNKSLVKRVIRIANELGREIASVDEAREILGLSK